jgi:hypothetical protein
LANFYFLYKQKLKAIFLIFKICLRKHLYPILVLDNQYDFQEAYKDKNFLDSLADISPLYSPTLKVKGFCIPCSEEVDFIVDMQFGGKKINNFYYPNLRERLVCPLCLMNNRQRLIAALIKQVLVDERIKVIYFMEQVTPIFLHFKTLLKGKTFIGSEYLGFEFKSGKEYKGINHQDIENLSFRNDSIDLIVSNDVFEHVPNPQKAFCECYRALKKNGIMIFTIPFHSDLSKSVRRANLEDGVVNFILPEVFHGNPISQDGSLVFTDFGWDIFSWFKKIGFSKSKLEIYSSIKYGHLGGGQPVFRLIK